MTPAASDPPSASLPPLFITVPDAADLVSAAMDRSATPLNPEARPFTPRDLNFGGTHYFAPPRARKRGGKGRKSRLKELKAEAASLNAALSSSREHSTAGTADTTLVMNSPETGEEGYDPSAGLRGISLGGHGYFNKSGRDPLLAPKAIRTHHHRLSTPPGFPERVVEESDLVARLEGQTPPRPASVKPLEAAATAIEAQASSHHPVVAFATPSPSTLTHTVKDIISFEHQITSLDLLCAHIDTLLTSSPLVSHTLAQRVARRFAADRARAWVIIRMAGTDGKILEKAANGVTQWCGAQWEIAKRVLGEEIFEEEDEEEDGEEAVSMRREMESWITNALAIDSLSAETMGDHGKPPSEASKSCSGVVPARSSSPTISATSSRKQRYSSVAHRKPLKPNTHLQVNEKTLPKLLEAARTCAERLAWLLRVLCEMEEWEWTRMDREAEELLYLTQQYDQQQQQQFLTDEGQSMMVELGRVWDDFGGQGGQVFTTQPYEDMNCEGLDPNFDLVGVRVW